MKIISHLFFSICFVSLLGAQEPEVAPVSTNAVPESVVAPVAPEKPEDKPVIATDQSNPDVKVESPKSEVPVVPKVETVPLEKPVEPRAPKFGVESVPIPEGQEFFVGARYYEKKSGGWGWIKRPDEDWKKARWVAIKETPRKFHVPHRALKNSEADHEFQYKILGKFLDYQIYDAVRDELLDVFEIQGYESLGKQKSIERNPGPSTRFSSRKSGAYTRRNFTQVDDD